MDEFLTSRDKQTPEQKAKRELLDRESNYRCIVKKSFELIDEIEDCVGYGSTENFEFAKHFRDKVNTLVEEITSSIRKGYKV